MKLGIAAALAIAITGQVLYHVAQKSVSPGAHPVVSLVAFYAIAALLSLPLLWVFPLTASLPAEASRLGGAVAAVAGSIVLIELGFLLAYRAGGGLSSSFVLTASAVTAVLFVVGSVAFDERVTAVKVGGIGLCLAGIWLISKPPS